MPARLYLSVAALLTRCAFLRLCLISRHTLAPERRVLVEEALLLPPALAVGVSVRRPPRVACVVAACLLPPQPLWSDLRTAPPARPTQVAERAARAARPAPPDLCLLSSDCLLVPALCSSAHHKPLASSCRDLRTCLPIVRSAAAIVAIRLLRTGFVNFPDSGSDDEEPTTPERMGVKPRTIQTPLKKVSGRDTPTGRYFDM